MNVVYHVTKKNAAICVLAIIIVFVILFSSAANILAPLLFSNPSNCSLNIKGELDYPYMFNAGFTTLEFTSDSAMFYCDKAKFCHTKQVLIGLDDGRVLGVNNSDIEVDVKEYIYVYSPEALFVLDESSIKCYSPNSPIISGLYSKDTVYPMNIHTSKDIQLSPSMVDSVTVDGYKVTNFTIINIDLGTLGYIETETENIEIYANDISKFSLSCFGVTWLQFSGFDGILGLDGNTYPIMNINNVNLTFKPNSYSSLDVNNGDFYVDGTVIAVNVDNQNLMKPVLFYWLDQKTDKISAYSTLINAISTIIGVFASIVLVAVTLYYAITTGKMLKVSSNAETRDFIEKRLECFYYPLEQLLATKFSEYDNTLFLIDAPENIRMVNSLGTYLYLAKYENYDIFYEFLSSIRKDERSIHINYFKTIVQFMYEDIAYYRQELSELIGN